MKNTCGFESTFVKSWGEWGEMNTGCFIFYDCKLTDSMSTLLDISKTYDVQFDLEKSIMSVTHNEKEVLRMKLKFSTQCENIIFMDSDGYKNASE